jgi:regulatory protein
VIRTVTGLRERARGKVEVHLDETPWRAFPAGVVVRAGLQVGRPLDRQTARLLAQELRREKALRRATRALASRDRSRGELEARLEQAGVTESAREEALASLEAAGMLDDGRVAESRAASLARRGYGDLAIRADLRRRRIDDEALALAIEALEPEAERAQRLLDSHGGSPAVLRRLAARGFSRDTLEDLTASIAQEA